MRDKCKLCRYIHAQPYTTNKNDYYCTCEDSPHFGESFGYIDPETPGCDCYEENNYSMDFVDAIKTLVDFDGSDGHIPSYKLAEDGHAMLHICFKSNKAMEDWRVAYSRLFAEVMKYRHTNGDFIDENYEKEEASTIEDYPSFRELYDKYMYREIGHHEFARELGVKTETLDRLLKDFTSCK